MDAQRTIAREASCEGVAIHAGIHVHMVMRPAPPGSGVRFRRVDLPGQPVIEADVSRVTPNNWCTVLERDGVRLQTIEHVLSAVRGLGVDNLVIDLDGEEPPAGDGSAALFVDMIEDAGVVSQDEPRRWVELERPVWVEDRGAGRTLVALPADTFRVTYTFVTDHPELGNHFADVAIDPDTYKGRVALARTIGWLEQLNYYKEKGLAKGGSFDIAIIVGKDELLTPLRFPNEVAYHKILDIVGDLSLVGNLKAHIVGVKSGHAMNARLARRIWQAAGIPVEGNVTS